MFWTDKAVCLEFSVHVLISLANTNNKVIKFIKVHHFKTVLHCVTAASFFLFFFTIITCHTIRDYDNKSLRLHVRLYDDDPKPVITENDSDLPNCVCSDAAQVCSSCTGKDEIVSRCHDSK